MKHLSASAEADGLDLLNALRLARFEGSLALTGAQTQFAVFATGEPLLSEDAERLRGASAPLHFKLFLHDTAEGIPLIGSAFPQSFVPTLRALPDLGHFERFPNTVADLLELFKYFRSNRFSGALRFVRDVERGLVLCQDGLPRIAFLENDGKVYEGSDALRSMRTLARSVHTCIDWRGLDEGILSNLFGLAQGRSAQPGDAGIASSEEGYSYLERGQVRFRVAAELSGRSGFYPPQPLLSELSLPEEPLGWETRVYYLTLRGRDALNPITELAMRLVETYGKRGKLLLEHLRERGDKGASPQALAAAFGLTLDDLQAQLSALEQDGLLRGTET